MSLRSEFVDFEIDLGEIEQSGEGPVVLRICFVDSEGHAWLDIRVGKEEIGSVRLEPEQAARLSEAFRRVDCP